MSNKLLEILHPAGFLSFGPESSSVTLTDLNVLIGPNGVGKSNFIEAIELLHAAPADFSAAIRLGGLPSNWIWHGGRGGTVSARLVAHLTAADNIPELSYAIEFMQNADHLEITEETLERTQGAARTAHEPRYYYYRKQRGQAFIATRQLRTPAQAEGGHTERQVGVNPQLSALSQIKDPASFPEFSSAARRLERIGIFREWAFGRSATLRLPQPANLPNDILLPQTVNLGLVLNELQQRGERWIRLNEMLRRFLPRFSRLTIGVAGGAVQIFLHEDGLGVPVPATRLSDGTLRFLCLLAILLNAESSSLICIEEPELGMHPDAMSILADLLVETSATTQIVVTTHSDALVSALTAHTDSVLVCDYGKNGTELRRLEADKLAYWLKDYALGDIWRTGKLGGNLF